MHDVAVERGQILVALHQGKQVGAHFHEVAGAAGGAVEPPDQLLPPRLGGKVKVAGVAVVGLGTPALDRGGELLAVGAEIARQRLEEGELAGGVEVVVAVEHVAGQRRGRSFAPAGQQRLAQSEQFRGVLAVAGRLAPPEQGAATFRYCGKQVGEEGVGHVAVESSWFPEKSYTGFKAVPITIKHTDRAKNMSCRRH